MKQNQSAKGATSFTPLDSINNIRCINSDRVCQGYEDVFVSTQTLNVQYARERMDAILGGLQFRTPSRSPSPVPTEARALNYYQINVANELGGSVDHQFWTRSILQLSETEPAIRQSLIAISDLWEIQAGQKIDLESAHQAHAELYNKALTLTARRVSEPEADTVALATCIIFLCLHCLKGDEQQTSKLLQTGSGVLNKVMRNFYTPEGTAVGEVAEMFLPMFERVVLLLRLFGTRMPHFRSSQSILYDSPSNVFSYFATLNDARSALYWLISESHQLIMTARYYRLGSVYNDLDDMSLEIGIRKQSIQLTAYANWLAAFDELCDKLAATNANDNHYQSSLRASHATAFIWLANCFQQNETGYDAYTDSFRVVLRESAKIIAHNESKTSFFTFEMGVIPPLFLTALKCRDIELRQQALALLERAPEREGLWTRAVALKVTRRVVDLETKQNIKLSSGLVLPSIHICDNRTVITDYRGTHIGFMAKLRGTEEFWHEWNEILPLGDDVPEIFPASDKDFTKPGTSQV